MNTTSIEWANDSWNPIRARLLEDFKRPLAKGGFKIVPAGTWGYHCERKSPGCMPCYACGMNGRTLTAWGTGLDYNRQARDKVEIYLDEQTLTAPLLVRKPRLVFVCSMTDLFGEFVPDEFIGRILDVIGRSPRHTFLVLTKRAERMAEWLRARSPAPNIWLGVSVEDQQRAGERIPHLGSTPAAVRWVSYEPALEAVDWARASVESLDWIVVGGESGARARRFDIAWARETMQACRARGVPVFVKQLGDAAYDGPAPLKLKKRKGGDPAE
jgi:protein gp37